MDCEGMATCSQGKERDHDGMAMHCQGACNAWECVATPLAMCGHAFRTCGHTFEGVGMGYEDIATCLKAWQQDRKFCEFPTMSFYGLHTIRNMGYV